MASLCLVHIDLEINLPKATQLENGRSVIQAQVCLTPKFEFLTTISFCVCVVFFSFLSGHMARPAKPSRPGMAPVRPAVGVQSPNYWATREVPITISMVITG